MAEFGLAGAELLLQLYLLEFYIRSAGLQPYLAGIALAIATFWDALTDPLMGGLVDHTRTRWGRFSPYIFGGGLAFGLGLVFLFHPPSDSGQATLFLYLLITYILVNTGLTIIGVPHIALGGVLSQNTHERTELYGWRLVFGTFGLFAGILSPLLAARLGGIDVTTAAGLGESRSEGSIIMAIAVVCTALLTIAATWRRSRDLPPPKQGFTWKAFRRNLGRVLLNKTFIPFYAAFLLVAMGRTMNATLALPYYKDSLELPEAAVQGPILSVFTAVIVLSVPVWVVVGRRFGKKWPAFWGMGTLGVMTCIAYPLFPQGSVAGPVIAAIIGGFAVGAIILVESLITDIADEDYVRNGEDREGIYFGFWRMGQKIARSITLGATGLLLSLIGYDESMAEQSESTQRALAWVFGGGVGSLFILGSLVFMLTPLSKAEQERIQEAKQEMLKKRKET
jgi:GPH family glycoside/pentoside/hexuronide:cation symporter